MSEALRRAVVRRGRAVVGPQRAHSAGRALRRLRMRLSTRPTSFRGVRLALDRSSANSESVLAGRFERPLMDHVLPRLSVGGSCIDVGAHVGYWTVPLASAVGPTGSVVAVEAHEPNIVHLRHNVSLNHLTNVTIVHAAAQDVPGTAELRVSGTSSSWNSITPSGTYFQDGVRTVTVPAIRLDDLEISGRIAVLKIDVEGAEALVLRGARELFPRCDMLVLEIGGERVTSPDYVEEVTATVFGEFDEVLAVDKSAGRLVPVAGALELRAQWLSRFDVTKIVAQRAAGSVA